MSFHYEDFHGNCNTSFNTCEILCPKYTENMWYLLKSWCDKNIKMSWSSGYA